MKRMLVIAVAFVFVLGASALLAQNSDKTEKEKPVQFKKTKDVSEPVLVTKVDPAYPPAAKQEKVMGSVVVEIKIGTDGSVLEATASKSPDARLSEAAISAIKQWKFKPALTKEGKPVEVLASITVNFKLK